MAILKASSLFFREKTMPTTKRESLIFTLIMCFFMVLTMSIYNI